MMYPGTLTLFTRVSCPHCVTAKDLLASKPDVRVVVVEIEGKDDAARKVLRALTNEEAKTVPQIFLNLQWLAGGASMLVSMERDGELDAALARGLADVPSEMMPFQRVDIARGLESH